MEHLGFTVPTNTWNNTDVLLIRRSDDVGVVLWREMADVRWPITARRSEPAGSESWWSCLSPDLLHEGLDVILSEPLQHPPRVSLATAVSLRRFLGK